MASQLDACLVVVELAQQAFLEVWREAIDEEPDTIPMSVIADSLELGHELLHDLKLDDDLVHLACKQSLLELNENGWVAVVPGHESALDKLRNDISTLRQKLEIV